MKITLVLQFLNIEFFLEDDLAYPTANVLPKKAVPVAEAPAPQAGEAVPAASAVPAAQHHQPYQQHQEHQLKEMIT